MRNTYTNGTTSITITVQERGEGDEKVTAYLADIRLADPTSLRSAFSRGRYGKLILEDPSTTAENVGAVFGVNGEFYGFRDNWIIIRNGTVYGTGGNVLAWRCTGTERCGCTTRPRHRRNKLITEGVWNTCPSGPAWSRTGNSWTVLDSYEIGDVLNNGEKTTIQGRHPRTGIGMVDPDTYVIIVVDGRSPGTAAA